MNNPSFNSFQEVYSWYEDNNILNQLGLDWVSKHEQALRYEELLEYTHILGEVLYGKESNRNDWNYHDFLIASAQNRAKALFLLFSSQKNSKNS